MQQKRTEKQLAKECNQKILLANIDQRHKAIMYILLLLHASNSLELTQYCHYSSKNVVALTTIVVVLHC